MQLECGAEKRFSDFLSEDRDLSYACLKHVNTKHASLTDSIMARERLYVVKPPPNCAEGVSWATELSWL
jgi:hypothetical protein